MITCCLAFCEWICASAYRQASQRYEENIRPSLVPYVSISKDNFDTFQLIHTIDTHKWTSIDRDPPIQCCLSLDEIAEVMGKYRSSIRTEVVGEQQDRKAGNSKLIFILSYNILSSRYNYYVNCHSNIRALMEVHQNSSFYVSDNDDAGLLTILNNIINRFHQ